MRLRLVFLIPALAVGACSGGSESGDGTPAIESSSPDYGSLQGGSRIVLTGEGFGAAPNRVLIGGREAPLAAAIDSEHLEVVVPPNDSPGDAEIIVFNQAGFGMATGVFRYSTEPVVDEVSPESVQYNTGGTVTLTGSGYLDEDAGPVTVLIDGEEAVDVVVESDTELTFTAPPGFVLGTPEITVINHRGEGSLEDGFRYGPGPSGGLLLWPSFNEETYLAFFDPISLEIQKQPRLNRGGGSSFPSYHSVMVDGAGRRLAQLGGQQFEIQEIFIDDQTSTGLRFVGFNIADMERVGTTIYALDRTNLRFGTFDPTTGTFTQIGAPSLNSQGMALAADAGGTMYVVTGNNLSTINRTTGALGTPIALVPAVHVTGMRFLGTTLYATSREGNIVTINTTTGATANVGGTGFQLTAMEVVQ
jgi:hypothetical protein